MGGAEDYKETYLCIYQQLIDKLMNLAYGTRSDINFMVEQLIKYNDNPRNAHL